MDLNDINPQDKMALEIDRRRQETEKEMWDVLKAIFKKPIENLSRYEKGFLRARASYLSKAQQEEYQSVLETKK